MSADPPRLFLVTYKPLAMTGAGRAASERFGLPPFIDGSIRREPDLEPTYPSISCLCRTDRFAPRLRPKDLVVYLARKDHYGSKRPQRRLTAVLRVQRLFDSHLDAAAWYRSQNLPLPNNCMGFSSRVAGLPKGDTADILRVTTWRQAMIKTLTKHGNSYAMVIDKPILELLHATPETPFEIISDGRSLVLTPVRNAKEEKKFNDALAMVHKRFGNAMKKLAE